MPFTFVVLHLLLTALAAWAAWRLAGIRGRWWLKAAAAGLTLFLLAAGALADRWPAWAAVVMRLQWPDAVFLSNLYLEAVGAMLALVWRASLASGDSRRIRRAILITPVALSAALWSYAWYFYPVPPGLRGRIRSNGLAYQTSPDSCSAAAAATLLGHYGIQTDEREMAILSLTRQGYGTPTLGLFRGLALKGRERGLRVEFLNLEHRDGRTAVAALAGLQAPSIISVGMPSDAPPEVRYRLERGGWRSGSRHAVVVLGVEPRLRALDIGDPSYGRELWPSADLFLLWDGRALVMRPESEAIGYRFPGFPPF